MTKLKTIILVLALLSDRQVKFFCIISWSSPVIHIVIKIPPTNDLIKWLRCIKSSNTKILVYFSTSVKLERFKPEDSNDSKIRTNDSNTDIIIKVV